MNPERLAIGRAAQRIIRFHTMPTLELQTVGAHTFGLCLLLIELTDGHCSANLLKAALFHDVAEAKVGDMPSPTLRDFPGLCKSYKDAGAHIEATYGLEVNLTDDEHRLVKLADRMELAFFALEDAGRGNSKALAMVGRVIDSIKSDDLVKSYNASEAEVMFTIVRRYQTMTLRAQL